MACLGMSLDNMIQNNRGNRVRGARQLDGHRCRGPQGLRGLRAPGTAFRAAKRLGGHSCRGPLGLRGVRGPRGTFRGVGQLDGTPRPAPLGLGGVRGLKPTFRGVGSLDGHPCRGLSGMRGVRGPGGTFRGVGPLGTYGITKTVDGTRNLSRGNSMLEGRFKAVGSSGVENGTKLLVSNLNVGVSNEDIRGLFSEIGELIRYGIQYDKDGSPCGSAEVVFARSSDAFEAVKRYNNTDLDGKPMKIEKVGSIVRARVAARLNLIGGANGRRTARMMSGQGYTRDASVLGDGAGPSGERGCGGVPIRGRGCHGRGLSRGGFGGRAVEQSAEEVEKELENHEAGTSQT